MKKLIPPYAPAVLLLALFIIISLFIYKDYGVSWDESTQREIGLVSYNYIFHDDYKLNSYIERDHGVGFELPLIMIEQALSLEDSSDIYLMRHLVTHFFFLITMLCGYVLTYRMFGSRFLASLAFIMLVCHPRLYAHSYFNTKDIPFLCMTLVSLLCAQVAFTAKNKRWLWFLLLGVACGYNTSIRIMGILMVVCLSLFFFIDIIRNIAKQRSYARIGHYVIFLAGFCASVYVAWPTLWYRPLYNFVEAYESMSHFRWDGTVLLNGGQMHSLDLPWYYLPEWFAITTPILWLLPAAIGIVWYLIRFLKKPLFYLTHEPERQPILWLAIFILPVASVIVLNAVVYDGWRHVYFIYPAFVMLAMYGIYQLFHTRMRAAAVIVSCIQVILVAIFFIQAHPFQQVYFNRLVSHEPEHLRRSFERDYWGASYLQALQYILEHEQDYTIPIRSDHPNAEFNMLILPADKRQRLVPTGREGDFKYFITNFRGHPHEYDEHGDNIVYSPTVQNSTVIRVYKVR